MRCATANFSIRKPLGKHQITVRCLVFILFRVTTENGLLLNELVSWEFHGGTMRVGRILWGIPFYSAYWADGLATRGPTVKQLYWICRFFFHCHDIAMGI